MNSQQDTEHNDQPNLCQRQSDYLEGLLSDTQETEYEYHVEECSACQAALDAIATDTGIEEHLEVAARNMEIPHLVHTDLLAAISVTKPQETVGTARTWFSAASVAVLLISLGIGGAYFRSEHFRSSSNSNSQRAANNREEARSDPETENSVEAITERNPAPNKPKFVASVLASDQYLVAEQSVPELDMPSEPVPFFWVIPASTNTN